MSIRMWLAAVASVLVLGATCPDGADAFHLTGTWIGKWSCKGFDGAKFKTANKISTMLISQLGDTVNVDIDGGEFHYNGRAIADDAKPEKGEVVLVECDTDNAPAVGEEAEMVRAQVKTKVDAIRATYKAVSIFEDAFPSVGTCKYNYERIDTTNSGQPPCM